MGQSLCMGKQAQVKHTVWLALVLSRTLRKLKLLDQKRQDPQVKLLEHLPLMLQRLEEKLQYFLYLQLGNKHSTLIAKTREMIMEFFCSVWKTYSPRYTTNDQVTSLFNVVTLKFTMSKYLIYSMMKDLNHLLTFMKTQQRIVSE